MAPVLESCANDEPWRGPYLEVATSLPLCIIFQISLLFTSIYQLLRLNTAQINAVIKISQKTKILYILLQCIGLIWTISDLLRVLIDPFTRFLRLSLACDIVAVIPHIIPVLFYLVYLYQVFVRLETSLTNSYLQISRTNVYILNSLIFIPIISTYVVFITLSIGKSACFHPWNPSDLLKVSDKFGYCAFPLDDTGLIFAGMFVSYIVILNIMLATIFATKLKKLLSDHDDNEDTKIHLKILIVKNTILSVTGSITTIICWFGWYLTNFGILLYIDLCVNCMVIGLMFRYNDMWYKRFCKCFIIMCFMKCDKSKEKMSEEAVMRYISNETDMTNLSSVLRLSQLNSSSVGAGKKVEMEIIRGGIRMPSIADMVSDIEADNKHELNSNADSRVNSAHVRSYSTR